MPRPLLPIVLLTTLFNLCLASTLHLSISPSNTLLDLSSLSASTHATLYNGNGKRYTAPLRRDNSFVFPELEEGEWLLDVHARDWVFPSLRVDVADPSTADPKKEAEVAEKEKVVVYLTHPANVWSNTGAKLAATSSSDAEVKVAVSALGKRNFYEQRTGFDLLGFFKNPMILMGVVSMGLVFGMPYLMDNMDPEMKAEFEEIQKNGPMGSQGAASQIQNFDLAGWMAGKSDSAPSSAAGSNAAQQKSGNNRR